jgi:prepilin-type processing-associated H-X9-DG protein
MNGYLGVRAAPYTAGYQQFAQSSELRQPPPSRPFVFIDEREESINDGWFAVDMAGYSPPIPAALVLVDYPAAYHEKGAGFSFADGHAELKRWIDARTVPVLRPGQILPLNQPSPNNTDVMWLQARSSSRLNNQ